MDLDLVPLDEATFRQRFQDAFKIDPSLTAGGYYQKLVDVDFDEQKALLRLRLSLARNRRPDEFPIPKSLAPETIAKPRPISAPSKREVFDFLSESPTKKSPVVKSAKKRSTPHRPIEDSDDEPLAPRSERSTGERPLFSPLKRSPHRIPGVVVYSSFDSEDLGTMDEELDDIQHKSENLLFILQAQRTRQPHRSP